MSHSSNIFPGPAGLLNDAPATVSRVFKEEHWKRLSDDYTFGNKPLHEQFNIAWIKQECGSTVTGQKAPFLAAVLTCLEISDKQKCVNITLKDLTGTIKGNILSDLYEQYASQLTLGAILVLVHVGVLFCTCEKCDNHHFLTVTPNNLAVIYNSHKTTVIRSIEAETIVKEYVETNRQMALSKKRARIEQCNTVNESKLERTTEGTQSTNDSFDYVLQQIDIAKIMSKAEDEQVIKETLEGVDFNLFFKDDDFD